MDRRGGAGVSENASNVILCEGTTMGRKCEKGSNRSGDEVT